MAAVVGLSTIFVCGGLVGGQANNTCEQFADNKWTYMSITMPDSIAFFAMTSLNDELFIFGGNDVNFIGLNTVYKNEYKYTASTLPWSVRMPMPVVAYGHAVVALLSDTILLCGGTQIFNVANKCILYTPFSNKWDDSWPMKVNRTGHALSLYKGIVYAYGGTNETSDVVSSIEMLSYTSGWHVLPYTMNQSDAFFASVVLPEPTASIWSIITPAICIIVLSAIVVVYAVLKQYHRQLVMQRVFIKDVQYLIVC